MDREDSIIIERLKQFLRNKDKKIERLRKVLEKIVEREKYISDDEYLPATAGEIAQRGLEEGRMKVYMLKDSDFQRLLDNIDRNPEHGRNGGSSQVMDAQERRAHKDAHRFYNYQIRNWMDSVKGGE